MDTKIAFTIYILSMLMKYNVAYVYKSIKIRPSSSLYSTERKKIIFLGTPSISAQCLEILHETSKDSRSIYEVAGVVTQPPAPSGRNKKLTPSPVQLTAERLQLPVFIPEKANEPDFLKALTDLNPDLCITAAYGNFLPRSFLSIPKYGTLNIHPSNLPKYRGASPVQRALENGDKEISISILQTVLKMDAGPVVKQIPFPLTGNEKATEILEQSFALGIQALINMLPAVWEESLSLTVQDESQATIAPKLSSAEARVDFSELSALAIHNRCRGFSEWPGIWSMFSIGAGAGAGGDGQEPQKIKILTTVVIEAKPNAVSSADRVRDVVMTKVGGVDAFRIVCGDGSVLGVTELQPVSRKAMKAKDFANGLRGQSLRWELCPLPVGVVGVEGEATKTSTSQ
eukprot:gene2707-5329_t